MGDDLVVSDISMGDDLVVSDIFMGMIWLSQTYLWVMIHPICNPLLHSWSSPHSHPVLYCHQWSQNQRGQDQAHGFRPCSSSTPAHSERTSVGEWGSEFKYQGLVSRVYAQGKVNQLGTGSTHAVFALLHKLDLRYLPSCMGLTLGVMTW